LQKLSSSGRTLVHFAGAVKEEMRGQNSPWRIHEVARAVGSKGVESWIRVGRNHPMGSRIQQRSLIITIECKDHSEIWGLEVIEGRKSKVCSSSESQKI
jgi:hypothetical protein